MDEHFKNIATIASVRRSLLNRAASCHWGLEVGAHQITHDAVIKSLLRYALAVTGSAFPPDLVRRVNAQIINIAARRIGGVRRNARIESLRLIMNTATFVNLYLPHCAIFLDGRITAQNSGIFTRLRKELAAYYSAIGFETQDINIVLPQSKARDGRPRIWVPDRWYNTARYRNQYKTDRVLQNPDATKGTCVCNAKEIERPNMHRQHVYCV